MLNNIMKFFGALKDINWNKKIENMKNLIIYVNKIIQKIIKN